MAKKLILALLLIAAIVAAFWWQQRRAERAEMEAGLAASRTLSAVFERTAALQVARLSGEAVTRVDGSSGYGMFANVQTTRAPYTVDYLVDLRRLSPADYRWNAKDRVMVVTVPEVTVGKPNIDLAQARTAQGGLFISRRSGLLMQQRVAGNLALAAARTAGTPDNLVKARQSARAAVKALVEGPLTAAGIGDVKIVVRLPGEARPAGLDREQWDMSRPIADVLREVAE